MQSQFTLPIFTSARFEKFKNSQNLTPCWFLPAWDATGQDPLGRSDTSGWAGRILALPRMWAAAFKPTVGGGCRPKIYITVQMPLPRGVRLGMPRIRQTPKLMQTPDL